MGKKVIFDKRKRDCVGVEKQEQTHRRVCE